MKRIADIGELYGMTCELFVDVICPKCENSSISTMFNAETVLIFGCPNCTDIEQCMLTEMRMPIEKNNIPIEIIAEDAMAK